VVIAAVVVMVVGMVMRREKLNGDGGDKWHATLFFLRRKEAGKTDDEMDGRTEETAIIRVACK
jgi:hypothetical protein